MQKKGIEKKFLPDYIIILLIIIIGFLVYFPSLKGVFVFDDRYLVIENSFIRDFTHIKDVFTSHLYRGSPISSNFYRPLQSLLLILDYRFWRLQPFGYHLTNILIHILNSVFVYFLIGLISKRRDVGFLTALLFSVHTVLSGTVNYVSSQSDLLNLLFLLISLILYVLYIESYFKGFGVLLYIGSLSAFLASILSKEAGFIIPFIILFYLYCFSGTKRHGEEKRPGLIWIFFIVAGLYGYMRATVLNFAGQELLEKTTGLIPLHLRLFTASKVIMIYLRLLVFPVGLHMEWDIEPAVSFAQDEVLLSVVGIFIITGYAYFISRKSNLKFFALGWFFIALLPYYNILPLNYFMGEGWLYVPSIGFFMLLSLYFSDLRRKSRPYSLAVSGVVIIMVIFYGLLTIKRADIWAHPIRLYKEVLRYSPDSIKARINLGVLLEESGSYEDAVEKYEEASRLNPEDAMVYTNLAVMYFRRQMYDQALEELKKAVRLKPDDYVSYNDIGLCYKKKGSMDKAMEAYKKALELNPDYSLTYNNIGNIYLDKKQYNEAISFYKKAVELESKNEIFYKNLGRAYESAGMPQKAREAFEKAGQLKSD